MVAAAVAGSSLVGAVASSSAASKAASAQENAANQATQAQLSMYNQNAGNLAPFRETGQNALQGASNLANQGFSFQPTMQQLEQTPGYQFALKQGLESVQNGFAARGLGGSGAAMKGAADYATGLASNTYQQQFGNALQSWQNNYNALSGLANLGENAAAQQGSMGTSVGQSVGNNLIGAGNAAAGASIAGGNAISGAANNIGSLLTLNALSGNSLLGSGGGNSGLYGNPISSGALPQAEWPQAYEG